jgi:ribosomal protein L40E
MSFGVDVLGTLTEKLKYMFDETKGKFSIFTNERKLYQEQAIDEKDFIVKIIEYLVNLSALNFLSIRVVLELKSAMDKGTSVKDATGGLGSSASQQPSFGIGGFIGTGGSVGIANKQSEELPTLKPVDIVIERDSSPIEQKASINSDVRICHSCEATISSKAKFCSKCGTLQ